MVIQTLINNITPDTYQALKRAIELGKWPNGEALSEQQKALCMEAVIRYDNTHLSEQQRVGYIDRGSKQQGEVCDGNQEKPLKWP